MKNAFVMLVLILQLQVRLEAQSVGMVTTEAQAKSALSILDFGGKADNNSVDNAAALNAAIRAASSKSLTISFPCGVFRFGSKPDNFPTGIRLVGCGSVGSTPDYGTNLLVDYDERSPENGFLEWDGSYGKNMGKCCAGTGGGIDHLSVVKSAHHSGGTAIKLTGSEDSYRAGFFNMNDVIVKANGDGSWDHDLVIDGTCCKTYGGQGVRDVYVSDFFAAQATSGAQAILLRNSVQFFWLGGQVFPAKAAQSSGITITGSGPDVLNSTNIFISNVYVGGDLVIDKGHNVNFSGLVGGNLTIAPEAKMVFVSGIVGGRIDNRSTTATVITATGINGSSAGVRHKRATITVEPKSRSTFRIQWDVPFADLNYTVSAEAEDPSGQTRVVNIQSQTTDGVTILMENPDERAAHIVVIHLLAMHD